MENVDLSQVYFFHYRIVPRIPSEAVQAGFADVCSIAGSREEAALQRIHLLDLQGFSVQEELAWRPASHPELPDLDTLELTLLAKALQRTPQVAAHFVVAGAPRDVPLLMDLPLPADRTAH